MKRIVLASNNSGKVREFGQLLRGCGIDIQPQSVFGVTEVEETGLSFVENAIIKARHAASVSGLPAMADDSGIEVDVLAGAPGVYSARYAGPQSSDKANNAQLLVALKDVPEQRRGARFQCVIVLMRHVDDPMPVICTGTWEGRILFEPSGANGFGYDPLFYVPTHGCASAELPPEVKNQISHRAQALQALKRILKCTNEDPS
ncbi:MAG: RdgB/HAM1 family non-canonical purine NTP pyrophosphatase [Pseudomonadota bacterium]